MLKIDIAIGNGRIKLEGNIKEVESVLDKHWKPYIETLLTDRVEGIVHEPNANAANKPSSKAKKPSSSSKASKSNAVPKGSEEDQKFEEALANQIKASNDFTAINTKFIVGKASLPDRCKLVISFAEKPVHSGNISRILTRLGVKNVLRRVSTALSNNKAQFLTSGTNPVMYEFTATTKQQFEEKLKSQSE